MSGFFLRLSLFVLAAPLQVAAQSADDAYLRNCASCHGPELRGSEAGPALIGSAFEQRWSTRTAEEFLQFTRQSMPPTNPGSLSDSDYAAVVAHIRRANGWAVAASATAPAPLVPTRPAMVEWLHNRGDLASTSYSPLDQINRENVHTLRIAWRWRSDNFSPTPEFYYRATPLMADGVLYTTAGLRRTVVAIDAATGETLWMYRLDEGERGASAPRRNSGRGVSFWRAPVANEPNRVLTITPGYQLVALDAASGRPIPTFGDNGIVDLKKGLPRLTDLTKAPVGSSSPPVIVGDVVVVGVAFAAGGAPRSKEAIPGWIRAYDVRTGALKWTFHTIPQPGEFGNDTWKNGSWAYTGNTGVWPPFSADAERGLVYLPVEAPTGDFYGGHRHGDNLFADSLVCLDANTGERVWHFQTIHHDIWDYDLPAPPVLVDITVSGERIPAVVQVTKTGFAFVFNRVTGKPVWPIEERPVPQSDVPGERTAATQPFPTRPAPFEPQGLREEDLIDFTPGIRQQALEIVRRYRYGPMYMPPSVVVEGKNLGTLIRPNLSGGANWPGAAVDPETGLLYVSSISTVGPIGLRQDPTISDMRYIGAYGEGFPQGSLGGPHGLPLVKPPWGRITAIDLNTGDHVWMVPNGDAPEWARNNPALAGINLPRTGSFDQGGLLVTKTLLFAGEGSGLWRAGGGGNKLRAHDKATGAIIHELTLPANQSGVPMTYAVNGRQYIVVAVGAKGSPGELVALTLP
ncbi:MAG: PQQ-binding-like beta-propeller repeat protein [Steroidobacteraceae bacterium]|nr:PQQ-binding-like beta-propeller repeat protein [Steroidobacteraceae bacterium]